MDQNPVAETDIETPEKEMEQQSVRREVTGRRMRLALIAACAVACLSQIAQAQVGLLNAEETVRLNRLRVEQDIRSQLIDLQSAYDNFPLADRSSEIAAERLRLAREEYRLASRSFTELQQAIEEEANERREAINARYSFIDARITLEETIGGPLLPDSREP